MIFFLTLIRTHLELAAFSDQQPSLKQVEFAQSIIGSDVRRGPISKKITVIDPKRRIRLFISV